MSEYNSTGCSISESLPSERKLRLLWKNLWFAWSRCFCGDVRLMWSMSPDVISSTSWIVWCSLRARWRRYGINSLVWRRGRCDSRCRSSFDVLMLRRVMGGTWGWSRVMKLNSSAMSGRRMCVMGMDNASIGWSGRERIIIAINHFSIASILLRIIFKCIL